MRYVHVFTGLEREADEGALHWPWVAPERAEVRDRVARARTAAREEVAARVALSSRTATRRAGAKVKRTRRTAARTAAAATSTEGTDDA